MPGRCYQRVISRQIPLLRNTYLRMTGHLLMNRGGTISLKSTLAPPRAVTDYGIRRWRKSDVDQLILHYMQPHQPFRSMDSPDDAINAQGIFRRLEYGLLEEEEVWAAYRDNLEWVLDDVSLLIENVSADRIAITSDHGNSFGRLGIYGHPAYVPLKELKQVPWVVTEGYDKQTHSPELKPTNRNKICDETEEMLTALGYK
ncbi:hypothetical protein HTG_00950 [Natrinema mahii]|nr:hypothetical protein HTG_00950 [Natrinema mahii]